jgi:MerR family transcriptional regulator, Zn(II)-responsive regulator of zntA
MKVSELAKAANVSADTVRYYSRAGLLRPGRNNANGYQQYSESDLQRLRFVRTARQLGFSLKEITEILSDADRHRSPCPRVRDLFSRKLIVVEQQLRELKALRNRMRDAMQYWQTLPDGTPNGRSICRLIEDWHEQENRDE